MLDHSTAITFGNSAQLAEQGPSIGKDYSHYPSLPFYDHIISIVWNNEWKWLLNPHISYYHQIFSWLLNRSRLAGVDQCKSGKRLCWMFCTVYLVWHSGSCGLPDLETIGVLVVIGDQDCFGLRDYYSYKLLIGISKVMDQIFRTRRLYCESLELDFSLVRSNWVWPVGCTMCRFHNNTTSQGALKEPLGSKIIFDRKNRRNLAYILGVSPRCMSSAYINLS